MGDFLSSPSSPQRNSSFPVVAVGASAGGMEAFSELLRAFPGNPGMAFVFIQHVDPTHRSMLSEILGRTTSMAVSEVTDGVALESNHVYVIPANSQMVIKNGALRLTAREHRGPHLPIDHFFHSLADDRGDLAIGVILSGTASDGTQGCTAIKAAGGITFAQDEKTAKYAGMPRSAINAGCIDFVLTPKGIAQELARIGKHPYLLRIPAERASATALADRAEMETLLNMIRQVSGVDFTHYKMSTLQRRIKRRMILHRLEHLEDYVNFIRENPTELEELYREILIHVTGFFRDPDAFGALRKHVFTSLFQERKAGDGPIRIWIPGCSTGEEVYSIAIALLEYAWDIARKNPNQAVSTKEVQIFATDISDAALERARNGLYSEAVVADVSQERLKRFFVRLDGGYQINKSVREMCIFAKQDVTKDPPFSNLDLISCRNLLIYLGPVLQKRVIPTFDYALKPSGYLLLGSSESLASFSDRFTLIDKKYKIYQKKRATSRLTTYFGAADYTIRKFSDIQPHKAPPAVSNVEKEAERVLMNRFVPASIVVNEQMEIVQFRGKTGAYLEPATGNPTFSLSKMAREGLLVDLRDGIARAKKTNGPVRKDAVRVQSNGGFREIDLEIIPIRGPNSHERFYVVVFQESRHAVSAGRHEHSKKARRPSPSLALEHERAKRELVQLREQLQALIEDHETTLEEFKSANEEILSGNEELQSTNEELETAKEELQSSNEELTTLNEELQNRNTELSMANNDLLNLLANVNLPVVMVGNDLRIRRFTPPAEKLLNFLPGDVGRRLGEIRPNVDVEDVEALCRQVIDTAAVQELEIRELSGSWYVMRIRPYKTWDLKVDGAVISFQDIDALKRSLEQTRRYADSLIEHAREPIVVLDDQFRISIANPAFYRAFRLDPQQVETVSLFDLNAGRWNIPGLRERLQRVLSRNERTDDLEAHVQLPELGSTTLLFNARRVEAQEGRSLIFVSVEDITENRLQLLTIRRQSALSELAHDAVIVRDLHGRILSWNRGAEELYGFARDQALGAEIAFLLKTHYPKAIEQIRTELLHSSRWEGELMHTAANGERKYVSSRWALLREEDGSQVVLEINNDITALRQAEENQRSLSAFLMRAQDEERRRIARELHDSTGQKLAFAKMNLQNTSRKLPAGSEQPAVAESINAIDESIQEIRTLSQVLHPPLLDEAGLVSAVRWLVDGFSSRSGIPIDFEAPKGFHRPAAEAELALFRVVQECLTNIHRHSGATKGRIRLAEADGTILLEVSDTGKGFAPEILDKSHRTPVPGVGILGMKERLHQLSGTLDIRSGPKGTAVRASLPRS